jgi:hypothetical protein
VSIGGRGLRSSVFLNLKVFGFKDLLFVSFLNFLFGVIFIHRALLDLEIVG